MDCHKKILELMRNRLYDMCITFLNNVYVNNKTVYDEKSTRVYVEIQKANTVCVVFGLKIRTNFPKNHYW